MLDDLRISVRSLARLKELLYTRSNINMNIYKDVYVKRRLRVRMRAKNCTDVDEYLDLAERDKDEYKRLLNALTVNVTRFFRNKETFDNIRRIVVPEIVQNREHRGDTKINILSVGCSTGEEPYSVAICFLEYFKKINGRFDLRIIGTDVDKRALFYAIKGIYPPERMSGMSSNLIEDYFVKVDAGYQVTPELKKSVLFIKKDVLKQRVHRRFDLILARNILIYFSRRYQEMLETGFHRQLVDGGYLILGRTESLVGRGRHLFRTVSIPDRIYQKV
ncbi:MAG: protein-glutamate O-methyltransferase CheR [Deltaproteobacteria bacterium]|nr:protein-glutamate O-methyltransferase CheR [Candidatus Zymogenaceae bacterium]